jgi:pyrimidine deaminase RibD-like protein
MASKQTHPEITLGDHRLYMQYALSQARHSPPGPTNFCVGAVLVDVTTNSILSTGYSLELPDDLPEDPGTTHAEGCCFRKLAFQYNLPEKRLSEVLPRNLVLYTTMEPCNQRLSGKRSCVDRILRLKDCIRKVYCGVKEPEDFIDQSVLVRGRKRLGDAGVEVEFIEGLEDEILKVAKSGH